MSPWCVLLTTVRFVSTVYLRTDSLLRFFECFDLSIATNGEMPCQSGKV